MTQGSREVFSIPVHSGGLKQKNKMSVVLAGEYLDNNTDKGSRHGQEALQEDQTHTRKY